MRSNLVQLYLLLSVCFASLGCRTVDPHADCDCCEGPIQSIQEQRADRNTIPDNPLPPASYPG
ncbi:MAG: hypothetical protein AB8G99_00600 [Planctomycetaceae bacterium]